MYFYHEKNTPFISACNSRTTTKQSFQNTLRTLRVAKVGNVCQYNIAKTRWKKRRNEPEKGLNVKVTFTLKKNRNWMTSDYFFFPFFFLLSIDDINEFENVKKDILEQSSSYYSKMHAQWRNQKTRSKNRRRIDIK